jgi:hypothetical protein
VIVCLPQAGGTLYSGDPDHQSRWIQGDGRRDVLKNLPAPLQGNAFFPVQGSVNNTQTCTVEGQAFILAWDSAFADNAGFYKMFVKLKKGTLPPPVLQLKTKPIRK